MVLGSFKVLRGNLEGGKKSHGSQEFTGAPKHKKEKVPFTLNELKRSKQKIRLFFLSMIVAVFTGIIYVAVYRGINVYNDSVSHIDSTCHGGGREWDCGGGGECLLY